VKGDPRLGRAGGEDGFILPAVVAILLVVAAAGAAAVKALQTRSTTTAERATNLRLQGIADGTARFVALSLVGQYDKRMEGLGLPEDGTPITCPLPGGGAIALAVQDQAGLIDLNSSPRPFMADAFRILGVPDHEAATLAAEIVDARDENNEPEPNGAEAPQYRARGIPFGPRNAPFDTVDEIETLPSMTEAIAGRLRPFVTVHNPNGGIDASVTPGNVFAGNVLSHDLNRRTTPSPHQAYAITATAFGPRGARAGRNAILAINTPHTGTGLLSWRYATDLSPNGVLHPACQTLVTVLGMP